MNDIKRNNFIERYWLSKLSGELPGISLPLSNEVNADGSEGIKKKRLQMDIPRAISGKLKEISNHSDVGLFILFLSGLYTTLYKYTGVEDLLIGTISPKKTGVKDKILFCRNRISDDLTYKEFINQTKQVTLEAFNYSDYSFGNIYQKLSAENKKENLDIFNVAFIYDNIQNRSKLLDQFNLAFVLSDGEDELSLHLEVKYNSNLYSREMIQLFCNNLINRSFNIPEILEDQASKIDIICSEEKRRLFEFNKTGMQYPKGETISRLFEKQVEKTPDHISVVFEEKRLTYRELNERSNQLARVLREKGVKANTIVGIMMEKSIDMIVGFIAVLKAGGAYLPIDQDIPLNRIVSMLKDCKVSILLTGKSIKHSYTALQCLKENHLEPYYTIPRKRIRDLHRLPIPDRSLIDSEKYSLYISSVMARNVIAMQTARGCPYKCAYCSKVWAGKYVSRSSESIFEELQIYYEMGVRRFAIFDDIFNIDIKNSTKFFESIIKNNLDLQLFFPNGFRGDLLTKDYIDLVVEAGLVSTALALETASHRLQKMINKHLNLEKFLENCEYFCEKYPHVILELFTMHGFPTETEEEAIKTFDFIKKLRWVHFPYVFILKIYPGTVMADIALKNGVARERISRSENLAFHELSPTLPFARSFTKKYQADFLNEYFLSRERLMHVLPYQVNVLTRDELIQKYDSYLPFDIRSFEDILKLAGITQDELPFDTKDLLDDNTYHVPGLNKKIHEHFSLHNTREISPNPMKVLFLDLSQYFSGGDMLYDVVEPPLGAMYIMSYLNEKLGGQVNIKIAKSRVDFDSLAELKKLLKEFQPEVIAARSLTFYRDFFHSIIGYIRQWGIRVPIIAGGPYATSNSRDLLQDKNIDLVVVGEGEVTFCEIVEKMIKNSKKLPNEKILRGINGIAFVPINRKNAEKYAREIIMTDELADVLKTKSRDNLDCITQPSDPAYIIFTSGTTGQPKGIITGNRNAVNVLDWFGKTYKLRPGFHVVQFTNPTFDPSVEQIFGTLLHGAALFLPGRDLITHKETFIRFLDHNRVNIINSVPFILKELLNNRPRLKHLRFVISGGEKLTDTVKDRIIQQGYELHNQYGPTETTIDALMEKCSEARVTLGRPINNVRCYILGKDKEPVPIGVAGELYIAGTGVARGYVNRPELTAEKFIPDPFRHGECMYQTGDLGRWLPEGNIEFLGRADHQVKIRGFRIETEEIENQLLKHHDIKEAVVLAKEREKGNNHDEIPATYLYAYIVSEKKLELSELKNYLSLSLPDYMIPLHVMQIEKIPLSLNGKIDRDALIEFETRRIKEKHKAPRNLVEKKLTEIWAQVLGIEKKSISINANFFELGGNSLKSTILMSKIHTEFNTKIPLVDIFKLSTIQQQAGVIQGAEKVNPAKPVKKDDHLVMIKKGVARNYNLFLVHDGTGEVEGYVEFCHHSNHHFTYWGIRAEKIIDYTPQDLTIPEIAARYIDRIKDSQSTGPYYIAGWSSGGPIAYEVVMQLEQMNDDIGFLGLIDSLAPQRRMEPEVSEFNLESELNWIQKYLTDDPLKKELKRIPEFNRLWPFVVDYLEKNVSDIHLIKQLIPEYVAQVIPNYKQLGIRDLIDYLNMDRTLSKAFTRYNPQNKLSTPVHFFCTRQTNKIYRDFWNTWNDYCTCLYHYEISGDHFSIMKKPDVIRFANLFDSVIGSIKN